MNFLIRGAKPEDADNLAEIARQFSLLNLPPDKKKILEKIEISQNSFCGNLSQERSLYMFVAEDLETGRIAGSAQVIGKHGTPEDPSYSIQVLKKERFSPEIGVGFIHQILRLKINEDGLTEIGGLVLDQRYRGRPEKLGKLVSLSRFLYIGMEPDKFTDVLYAEMAPPLTDDGKSDFWEAYGRRFTGMPYDEADSLSRQDKEFIRSLFPEEDVYLCLLDSKARLALGRVGEETQPALHMLESLGFKYMNEVDPFDGGPHISVFKDEVSLIKSAKYSPAFVGKSTMFDDQVFVSVVKDGGEFFCGQSAASLRDDKLLLPQRSFRGLDIDEGQTVFYTVVP